MVGLNEAGKAMSDGYAYDKQGGAGCRGETYSLHEKDLRDVVGEWGLGLCRNCGDRLTRERHHGTDY